MDGNGYKFKKGLLPLMMIESLKSVKNLIKIRASHFRLRDYFIECCYYHGVFSDSSMISGVPGRIFAQTFILELPKSYYFRGTL